MPENRMGAGNLGNAFARLYGLDDINAIPGVAPEILPTSSIWERPELWALTQGKLGAFRYAAAAPGAGQMRYLLVNNPAGSNGIVVIERIHIATAVLVIWGTRLQNLGTTNAGGLRDTRSRFGASFFGTMAIIDVNAAATGTVLGASLGAMTGPATVEVDYVIQPGDCFGATGPDNSAWDFSVEWRERGAAPAELLLR